MNGSTLHKVKQLATRPEVIGLLALMILLTILSSASFLFSRPTAAQTSAAESSTTGSEEVVAGNEVRDFAIHAPYWSTEPGFVSTIQMRNYRVDESLTVTPVLYLIGGREVTLDPITLNPSETRVLNINEALAARGETETIGAAEIRYRHETEGVFGANLTALNVTQSLIANFPLRMPQGTERLEGIWWFLDQDTDGFVAAQNTSAATIEVTPTLYVRGRPHRLAPLELQPHEMKLIRLRQELRSLGLETAKEGGIQLESSIPEALIAGGSLMNPAIGFSSEMRFGDPRLEAERVKALASSRTLHALNVSIGAPPPDMGLPDGSVLKPIMVLRNVEREMIRVQPVFKYRIGG